ncbi:MULTISPECIES: hypothetical protein [Pseudonocardia]|uniref:Uncharacterized protein n=2 Tax=Pseudonocardia TaxID=1847 RepID=A0A1Y2N4D5_PSEAH|nr:MULTISPECIES: hypothetical protein [Pseudonocardia]OSY42340.1 hypothetical protein BG845_01260 [Pseudonocardia autotrophica]TDN75860.1 hypothetical protein C8E95_5045 [Pseudonocardia autotrophica]BBF99831.1 hypothetical protein Pdca_10410 [Pseudonocardia autotrophica]GEC27583.1 hypothetical protein PSA01_46120 [Pseudonocardia saturnea]
MWVLISRHLRVWLLLAVGAPILAWLLGRLGDAIERRRGPNVVSKLTHQGRRFLERRVRGPLRRRERPDADQLAR